MFVISVHVSQWQVFSLFIIHSGWFLVMVASNVMIILSIGLINHLWLVMSMVYWFSSVTLPFLLPFSLVVSVADMKEKAEVYGELARSCRSRPICTNRWRTLRSPFFLEVQYDSLYRILFDRDGLFAFHVLVLVLLSGACVEPALWVSSRELDYCSGVVRWAVMTWLMLTMFRASSRHIIMKCGPTIKVS